MTTPTKKTTTTLDLWEFRAIYDLLKYGHKQEINEDLRDITWHDTLKSARRKISLMLTKAEKSGNAPWVDTESVD